MARERREVVQRRRGVVDLRSRSNGGRVQAAGEVAPLRQVPRGPAQAIDRAVVAAERGAPQRAPHAFGRIGQLLLQPASERLVEQPRRRRLGEDLEQRIDPRFDRALAQQVGAEAVDGADVRLLEP